MRAANRVGSLRALERAEAILDQALTKRAAPELRARVFELAEALFQSIRMQLSAERYHAISVGRGANLDTSDVPLNNGPWLRRRFAALRGLERESDRLKGIDEILNWQDPGPGGFYDELGNPSRRPHLVAGEAYERDPSFLRSPLTGFNYEREFRLSWCRHAESLNDTPLRLRYTDLDKEARYKVWVTYAGDSLRGKIRLTANEGLEVHPYRTKPRPLAPVEFDLPSEATRKGELTLTWAGEPGRGGNGRGCQVAEVWLIKK